MHAMGTSPAASLDTGKGGGNRSFDTCSWGISRPSIVRGEGREKMIACYQASEA
jgi:hypothetical protein